MKVGTTDGPQGWLQQRFGSNTLNHPGPDVEVLWVHQTVVDESFLARFPALRGIIRLGVGYDKIDLAACAKRGVQVANVPDYCTDEVAQSTLAFALDWARGHNELEAALHADPARWQHHSLHRIRGLQELTFGAIGVGRIGSRALDLARAVGFKTVGFDLIESRCHGASSLAELLDVADIVSLHVPLTPLTSGLVDALFIDGMKSGSFLINTARGGLLGDALALIEAIETNRLHGAAVDVLPEEPWVEDSALFQYVQSGKALGKLRITPHNAFHSSASANRLLESAAQEVERLRTAGTFKHRIA